MGQYRSSDFDFDIEDVAILLNLTIRRHMNRSIQALCPFCDDTRGKLNLNLEKNVWRCARCGEHGGMLALYGKLYNLDNSDAYREICELRGTGDKAKEFANRKQKIAKERDPQADLADIETRHQVYSLLLSMLILTSTHSEALRARGMTDEQIIKGGYRSTPAFGFEQLARKLINAGCNLAGIPGFYLNKNGNWTMNLHPKGHGILVPYISLDGKIQGLQIRADVPLDGHRYYWLSSSDKNMGCSCGTPVHFIGNPQDETIYVTEGGLKGAVAHHLSGKTFLCNSGVNCIECFGETFEKLKKLGAKRIVLAYDMDMYRNDKVLKAFCKLHAFVKDHGFEIKFLSWEWSDETKGVDDILYYRQQENPPEITVWFPAPDILKTLLELQKRIAAEEAAKKAERIAASKNKKR